jgi:hypothetical protein
MYNGMTCLRYIFNVQEKNENEMHEGIILYVEID